MSIERNYEYKKENSLLYNVDNYDINDGLSIEFSDGMASLRNINSNPKSNNFFGDGRLGSQTYVTDKMLSPTCCYFQSLLINDPLYGTHLQGVFAETGVFNIGDEVILYKKYCSDKSLYDEVGKWDIVTIINVIEDQGGINRYVIDKVPDNEYVGSDTVNSATLVLQFDRLTVGGKLSLQADNAATNTTDPNSHNWRDKIGHPEVEVWKNRELGNPRGIMYIKVKNDMLMLEGSSVSNHIGTYGGRAYKSRPSDELDSTKKAHDQYVPSCGFLPSPSDGMAGVDSALPASDLCDFAGYHSSGGSSFSAEGNKHANTPYTAMQIPAKYRGANGDLDKMFMGMPASYPSYASYWGFGSDGGGIIIVQAKKLTMEEGTIITTPSVYRHAIGYNTQPTSIGAGGTTIVKCPDIVLNMSTAPISTLARTSDDTYLDRSEEHITHYGISNQGTSVMEFENISINGVASTFQDVQNNFEAYKDKLFMDYKYMRELPTKIEEDGTETPLVTADSLARESDYPTTNVEDTLVNTPTTSMAEYETGKYYKVYTKGLHNIDTGLWNSVNGFNIEAEIPTDTDVRILLSRDGGDSWFKINVDGGTAGTVTLNDIGTKGNTVEELVGYTDSVALTGLLVSGNTNKTLDIAVGMVTTKQYKTPSIDNVTVNYEGIEVPDAPIRILPYHEEEFDREEVDFVWMQPMQRAGSLQNRIEISPTSDFDPKEEVIDMVNGGYSSSNAKIHLPYVSKLVDNRINSLSDVVLPYLMVKGSAPESTYDEGKTSCRLSDDLTKIVYSGDTFFVKGTSMQLPSTELLSPDVDAEAPLQSTSNNTSIVHGYKMSGVSTETEFSDSVGTMTLVNDHVALRSNSYLGSVAYFNGDASMSMLIPQDSKKTNILTKLHTERTIHIKFNPKVMPSRACLFSFRKDVSGTEMFSLDINTDSIIVNGVSSYYHSDNYLEQRKIGLDEEHNVTIVVYTTNRCDVYHNGFKVIQDVVYNSYPTYIDGEDDTPENDVVCDIGVCLGRNYEGGSEPFYGSMHEFVVYDYAMSDSDVLSISKLPIYHMRYDLRDDSYKLLQYPYSCTELMYDNKLWGYSFNNDGRQLNHFANPLLANHNNVTYASNNDTILIGKYSSKTLVQDSFKSVTAGKHIIMGYNFYTNDWDHLNNMSKYTLASNNTIEQNYTGYSNILVKSGRINKQTTTTEIEFIHTDEHRVRTTQASISIRYGVYSAGKTDKYYAIIHRRTDMTYYLKVSIGIATYNIELPEFKPGHRYTLSMVPVDGSFQSNVLVKLYSSTNTSYSDNKVLFSSSERYGYNSHNHGFTSEMYEDMTQSDTTGDWVDVGCGLISIDKEFALIGMTCLDAESVVVRDNGYVDSYFIEKRLPAGLTYNIIRMDVLSEIRSAMTSVRSIISFDNGTTWKVYDSGTETWSVLTDIDTATVSSKGMPDSELYTVTDSVAVIGGFNNTSDTILRTYLITKDNSVTPRILSHKVLKNGPRVIDSWREPGSYYHSEYEWHYLNDGTWNPYIAIDTTGSTGQGWEEFGTGVPNPTIFVEGSGSKPSTNLLKTYAHVKVDCLPKGKWYWRVSAYNGLKR